MSKKLLAVMICITLLGTLLIGCGGKQAPAAEEKTTAAESSAAPAESTSAPAQETEKKVSGDITFCSYRTDWANDYLPQLVADFNKKFPEVKVTVDTQKDYDKVMKVKMSANDLPDVWNVHANVYSKEALSAYLNPLDDLEVSGDFSENDLSFYLGVDKKPMALPQGKGVAGVVIYNKEIFQKLNLTVPKTLDDFIKTGKAIKEAGYVGLAFCTKDQWTMCQFDSDGPIYFSGDSAIFNKTLDPELNGGNEAPFTIDGPWGKTFKLIAALRDAGISNPSPNSYGWEPFKVDFQAGKVGMFFMSGWFMEQGVTEDKKAEVGKYLGVFPLPFDNSGNLYYAAAIEAGLAVSKSAKNQDAAKAFINFLLTDKYEEIARKGGMLSARKGVSIEYEWSKDLTGVQSLVEAPKSEKVSAIWQKGPIDFSAEAAGILAGVAPEKAVENMNKAYKKGLEASK